MVCVCVCVCTTAYRLKVLLGPISFRMEKPGGGCLVGGGGQEASYSRRGVVKRASGEQPLHSQWTLMGGHGGAPAHSHLLLVLHVGQLHILFVGGGWGRLQVAADHELVYEDTGDGTQERRDCRCNGRR